MVLPVELLGLSDIEILNISLRDRRELIIEVKSTKDDIVCRNCGRKCEDHGYDRAMELRHLPILGYKTFIQIAPKRGICYQCAEKSVSTTQTLSWYDRRARQTKPYEQHLLFEMINSTIADVSRKEEIDEETIQTIIDKNIATDIDFSIIMALGIIGIDEISLRKGRKRYVTVITYRYKDEVKLLKIIEGRNKDDILKFFKSIPARLRNTVSAVCSDLYEGYINAAKEVFGNNVV
ncbi:transposase, partial [Cysteiniphilum marinum]|uniref:transposase n=2 Tax=Cysteiniphilum marinum TaxID=2774191 RepID=UPI001F2F2F2B